MRARTAFLAAALCLSACTEGKSPIAPVEDPGPAEEQLPPEPLPGTDVLGNGPESAIRPPPEEVAPAPLVIPVTGSATVVGSENGPQSLSVPQVDVDLTVGGVRGRGTVEVEFVSPAGLPYERRSSVVEAQPEMPRTMRFSLPVAGTSVSTTGMSGTWQVRFFLDGESLTTAAFTLEP